MASLFTRLAYAVPLASAAALKIDQAATAPLSALFSGIRNVFEFERRKGFRIRNDQPEESFDRTNSAVRSLLAAYGTAGHTDWLKYAHFSDEHCYVRNLVDANQDFELMVICWAPGQRSRIHNHASSHCWAVGLQGVIEEVQYQVPRPEELGDPEVTQRGVDQSAPPSPSPNLPNRNPTLSPSSPSSPSLWSPLSSLPATTAAPSFGAPRPQRPKVPKQLAVNLIGPGATTYVNDHMCLHTLGCPSTVPAPGAVSLHVYAPPISEVDVYCEDGSVTPRVPDFYSVRGIRV